MTAHLYPRTSQKSKVLGDPHRQVFLFPSIQCLCSASLFRQVFKFASCLCLKSPCLRWFSDCSCMERKACSADSLCLQVLLTVSDQPPPPLLSAGVPVLPGAHQRAVPALYSNWCSGFPSSPCLISPPLLFAGVPVLPGAHQRAVPAGRRRGGRPLPAHA